MWSWVARLVRRRGAVMLALATAGGCNAAGPGGSSGTDSAGNTSGAATTDSGAADGAAGTSAKGSGGGANEEGTGAPLPEYLCKDRSECVLHSDCCSCVALHVDQEVPACADDTCQRGTCEVWGIERYLCSHTCHIELVECDPAMVTCTDPPPDCADGMLPSVDERCWSNHCVPEDLCRPIQ